MKTELFSLLLLAMTSKSFAQVARKTPCPNYTTPEGYSDEAFSGRWYEFAKTGRLLEPFTKCIYFEYSKLIEGKKYIVTNQRTPFLGIKINHQISVTPTQDGEWKSILGYSYRVFATDNKRFAVIHACKDGFLGSSEVIWILTRERKPDYPTAFEAQYYVFFEMERYNLHDFIDTDQDNCPENDDAFWG